MRTEAVQGGPLSDQRLQFRPNRQELILETRNDTFSCLTNRIKNE